MEHRGKCRQRVGAWSLHLAHHVHHDGACLAHGEPYLAAAVARTQRRAQLRIGLCHSHSCHLHRSESLYSHRSVGAHGALNSLLRSTVNVNEHSVARPQTVVLRCGDVHVWLEGEHLVVEDVASEHLALAALLVEHFKRVGQHVTQLVVDGHKVLVRLVIGMASLASTLHPLRCAALRLQTFLLHLPCILLLSVAVVHAHSRGDTGAVVNGSQSLVFLHAVDGVLHAAYLVDVNTTLHQFRYNLCLRSSLLIFSCHELHNLLVGHRRLGKCPYRTQAQQECYNQ